jgi:hypothetical protein
MAMPLTIFSEREIRLSAFPRERAAGAIPVEGDPRTIAGVRRG